MKTTDAGDTMF